MGGQNLVGTKKLKNFRLVCHERKFCENYLSFCFFFARPILMSCVQYRCENEAVFKDVLDLNSWDFDPHF